MSRHQLGPLLLGAMLLCAAAELPAQTRLIRRFAEDAGLAAPVWAIVQDSTGFLWIGAQGGLFRYDGASLHAWPVEPDANAVMGLAAHGNRVAAVTDRGELFELASGDVRALHPPGPAGPRTVRMLAYDIAGRLWIIRGGSLACRDTAGTWRQIPAGVLGDEQPMLVTAHPGGGVLVATDRGVWRADASGAARKLFAGDHIVDILALGDRELALRSSGALLVHAGADIRIINVERTASETFRSRAVALAQRGRTLWVAFDRFLVALEPGREPEVISPEDGIEAGGPMLVDREGSLWMGTYTSLLQFPEPDTRIWTDREGLPSRHVRFLARSGDALWITTWQGAVRLQRHGASTSIHPVPDWYSQHRVCPDSAASAVWSNDAEGLVLLADSGVRRRLPAAGIILGCAPARDGGTWLATLSGLFRVEPAATSAIAVTLPRSAPPGTEWQAVLEDRQGRLWLAWTGHICSRQLRSPGEWECSNVGATGTITSLVELSSGAIWASTMEAGVLRTGSDGHWDVIPQSRELPTDAILGLRPSLSGGVWIIGYGTLRRVKEQGPGWTVREVLGSWNGLPVTSGQDLLENPDGSLWVTTWLGLVEIPRAARFATADPPPVAIADASVDGRKVPTDQPFEAPSRHNTLELRFAALSFRDPARVRYQARLGADHPWTDTRGAPSFSWVDLPSGRYTAEFRASLDGRHWSSAPASVRFRVPPPWYREPWVLISAVIVLGAMAFAIYRARLNIVLGLERQRNRIALDLHDEIGSGLGSIGILASVLSDAERREDGDGHLAREIAATAEHLGESLSDIVWALDRNAADLRELVTQLVERGNRLFSADDGPEFIADLPERWPDGELTLAVRRNVLLIGLEALHNAARHSGASQVTLRLRPQGGSWRLMVQDDGRGFAAETQELAFLEKGSARNGRGVAGMRRRAGEIGAEFALHSSTTGGTTMRLDFRLQ